MPGDEERIHDRAAFAAAALRIAGQVRRELCIASQALDPGTYDQAEFVTVVQNFLLSGPRTRLRVLLADPRAVMTTGAHRLVELGLRLPSRVEFRQPGEESSLPRPELLLGDAPSALLREVAGSAEARTTSDPMERKALGSEFDNAWAAAVPTPELRVLGI